MLVAQTYGYGMQITFVTGNLKKFEEVGHILQGWDLTHQNIDLEEIQGPREAVIRAKAEAACEAAGGPVILEDVSLCLNCLNGFPGPYAKDFMRALGTEGVWDLVRRYDDHGIQAICMAAYKAPGEPPLLFEGTVEGVIVAPRGELAHGKYSFNAIFQPLGMDVTMGEMDMKTHAQVSHRMRAFQKLKEHFAELSAQ
jgi:inosine triphosphate pyrophosphatase